jgi:ABC-2 type transport system permease protein
MSPSLIAFRALVYKDVATFLRDRRALTVSLLTPIAIAAFFGFVFGGDRDSGVSKMPVGIVDLDRSAMSRAIVADLGRDAALDVESLDEPAAREKVKAGKLRAAIVLPAGFGAAASRALFGVSQKPAMQLLYDPSQSFVKPVIEGLVTQHVMQNVTRDLFSAGGSTSVTDDMLARLRTADGLAPETRTDLISLLESARRVQSRPARTGDGRAAGGLAVPFTLASEGVSTGPRYNSYAHSFAGMSVQFILFMGIDSGVGLLLMRELGVWRRLRAAPVSRAVLLGSRVAGTATIAMLILAFVYLVAILVFGVRIAGSVAGFAAVALAFALLAATAGLMIAALGRSVQATRGLSVLAVLLLVMLGGAWVPTFVFPEWLQHLSAFAPTRWAVDGFDAMTWRGLPASAAVKPVALLLLWSGAFLAVALWRFDWDSD